MLHRIVSRTVVVLAATAFLASCEDNTTGTPLTPPPASTAVYVTELVPDSGYAIDTATIPLPGGPDTTITADTTVAGVDTTIIADTVVVVDTLVYVVTPDPVFEVKYPDGTAAVGQVITFNLSLPGLIEATKDTVDAAGLVSPGRWLVAQVCPNPLPEPPEEPVFCRPTQTVIATPVAGNAAVATVNTQFPAEVPEPAARASR
jgi:hypothetical protein